MAVEERGDEDEAVGVLTPVAETASTCPITATLSPSAIVEVIVGLAP
ncbi:hypothetical protein AB0H42_33090 [Nocardia sp. NPDC050799]